MTDFDIVTVGNQTVYPLKLDGPAVDAFTLNTLVFTRPKWIPDNEVRLCHACEEKFTQLRRKHHCRNCGRIFCSSCCGEKVSLHHLGYDIERICAACRPNVNTMIKVQSKNLATRLDGANELCNMTISDISIIRFLEIGGHHMLIHLCKTRDNLIRTVVVRSLQNLCCQPSLHGLLLKCGVIKAIHSLLSETDHQAVELLQESVSLLCLLCKASRFPVIDTERDLLEPLLQLCGSCHVTLSLLAMQCLSQLAQNPATFDQIVDNTRKHHLTKIVSLAAHKEEKMQEVALFTLVNISCGTDWHKQRIIQEHVFQGGIFAQVLFSHPLNPQVLVNACCLLANLASLPQAEGALIDALQRALELLEVPEYSGNLSLLRHLARTTGNAALSEQNSQVILNHLPNVIKHFLHCYDAELQHHSLRIIVSLLQFKPAETLDILNREGSSVFLSCMTSRPSILAAIQQVIQTAAPAVSHV